MKIINQAAALPFRMNKDKLQVLIVTSRNKKKWILPKGIIERGDSEPYTALKETREEAGVSGQVMEESIGSYSYEKWGATCKVILFPLKVTEIYNTWDESHFRKRKWVKGKQAIKKVNPPELAGLIKKFVDAF